MVRGSIWRAYRDAGLDAELQAVRSHETPLVPLR
jgi:hypothetical protein